MINKLTKGFILFVALFIVSFTCVSAAEEAQTQSTTVSSDSRYGNYDVVIDQYDVNLLVNEDNTFDIAEYIGAYFRVPKHGIIRKIPLRNKVMRQNGTVSYNRVRISDIVVDEANTTSVSDGNKVIQIGSANATLTGPKNYNITYKYNLGKDTGKKYDELYFNLIGSDWDMPIGGVTFTITMPKEFDASKLGFSKGIFGSSDSSDITYQVNGKIITGKYNGVINPGEALTVRLELPDGYFVNATNNLDFLMVLAFVLPLLFVLLTLLMWMKYGKDNKVTETVEFYPPEGLNSAEVGFIYKGKADSKDVTSLLIYLADKGYIKISETEEKKLFATSKSFQLTKLKEYDGNNVNEQLFLNGLFQSGSVVTSTDLANKFYVTLNNIISNLNEKKNRIKIFEENSLSKNFLPILMIIITYFIITVKPVLEYNGAGLLFFSLVFPGIGFTMLFLFVFGNTKASLKIFGAIWGLGFGGVPWAIMVLPALLEDSMYLAAYIVGLACVFAMVILIKIMPKRTDYGNEMLGKIEGFKTFLETAEKPRLEELVEENPSYFYNILPFTYVLGVSDKWMKKFESISLQSPDWYDSRSAFNMVVFGNFIGSTMTSASSVMTSTPSSSGAGSSGGGGFTGGGFSGGGSGGGGGSSW